MAFGCVICSDPFSSTDDHGNQVLAVISCGHTFHTNCLLEWLERCKSCPVCRSPAANIVQSTQNVHLLNINEVDDVTFERLLEDMSKEKDKEISLLRLKADDNEEGLNLVKAKNKDLEKALAKSKKEVDKIKSDTSKEIASLKRKLSMAQSAPKATKLPKMQESKMEISTSQITTSASGSSFAGSPARRTSSRIAARRSVAKENDVSITQSRISVIKGMRMRKLNIFDSFLNSIKHIMV
jgi:hypothetical protein